MRNKVFLSFVIFLFNCNSNTDNSFNLLSESFSIWYYKNHPTLSTLHNYQKYDNNFKINNFKSNEEYLLDLNRFYFELTQINMQKLNRINKIQYRRIEKTILKLIYLNEHIKEQEWRPSIKLDEIEKGIKYLVNYNYIPISNRMEAINARLLKVEKMFLEKFTQG